MPERLSVFRISNEERPVRYIETTYPNEFVTCDVYEFTGDSSYDLAVIEVKPNSATPEQKILKGESTLEGFLSGSGILKVNETVFEFPSEILSEVAVNIGDTMQWRTGDTGLTFYEICYPPYEEGRFESLPLK